MHTNTCITTCCRVCHVRKLHTWWHSKQCPTRNQLQSVYKINTDKGVVHCLVYGISHKAFSLYLWGAVSGLVGTISPLRATFRCPAPQNPIALRLCWSLPPHRVAHRLKRIHFLFYRFHTIQHTCTHTRLLKSPTWASIRAFVSVISCSLTSINCARAWRVWSACCSNCSRSCWISFDVDNGAQVDFSSLLSCFE